MPRFESFTSLLPSSTSSSPLVSVTRADDELARSIAAMSPKRSSRRRPRRSEPFRMSPVNASSASHDTQPE